MTDTKKEHTGNKYHREIQSVHPDSLGSVVVDVYNVLEAYQVACPAIQHAVKKLLCAGLRGKGSACDDLVEARDAVTRAIELQTQRERQDP